MINHNLRRRFLLLLGLFLILSGPSLAQSATLSENTPTPPLKKASPKEPTKGKESLLSATTKEETPPPLSRSGPDALKAYRNSWNPLTAGPNLMPPADTLPEGEFNTRFFMYARFTLAQYSDSGGITGLPQGFSQTQLLDLFAMYYGLDSNTELAFFPSVITSFSTQDGIPLNGAGLNDLTFGIKHRWIIQNPNTSRPTFATAFLVTLPTTSWLGTPVSPGGLPPINLVPSTHFGAPAFTVIALTRKNVRPFRFYADAYYTWSVPGDVTPVAGGASVYSQYGDLFQYRFGVEDVIDDQNGFGVILEVAGLSGLPFSVDGLAVNAHPTNFNLIGLQPTIEYNITPRLAASFGVLLPVFGNNEYLATTPNFSLWYYFKGSQGSLLPR